MVKRLKIDRDFDNDADLSYYLQVVGKQIDEGFTSGDGWSCYEEGDRMDDDSGKDTVPEGLKNRDNFGE